MREIKFRAWDKRTRKMIDTGFHILGETTCFDLIYDYCMKHGKRKDEVGLLRINSVVIMQYTGLKDKNGKEIYEGDLLQTNKNIICRVKWCQRLARWEVEYSNKWTERLGKFIYKNLCWANERSELIGNIYENPELLEK